MLKEIKEADRQRGLLYFRSLKKRDFENDAVLEMIEDCFKDRRALLSLVDRMRECIDACYYCLNTPGAILTAEMKQQIEQVLKETEE